MTNVKVLLVDDERPFVETMVKRLKKRDLKLVTAFNGNEALNRLEEDGDIGGHIRTDNLCYGLSPRPL